MSSNNIMTSYQQGIEELKRLNRKVKINGDKINLEALVIIERNQVKDRLLVLYERLEEIAALIGRFNPSDFQYLFDTPKEAQYCLSKLFQKCEIETLNGVKWLLNAQARNNVLSRLIGENVLLEKMQLAHPPNDLFGVFLRRILEEGDSIDVKVMSNEELKVLANVLENISELHIPKPSLKGINFVIKIPGILDQYVNMAADFMGRRSELKQLHDFIKNNQQQEWEGFIINGIGGVGKSTLLAQFIKEIKQRELANIVVLDFDRPGINANNIIWLVLESINQLARQYPYFKEEFQIQIDNINNQRSDYGILTNRNTAWSITLSAINKVAAIIKRSALKQRPLIFVLDTVEEVAKREEISQLFDWIMQIQSAFYGVKLKFIFSGRLFDVHLLELEKWSNIYEKPLLIEEFDKTYARKFLEEKKLTTVQIEKILESNKYLLLPLSLQFLSHSIKNSELSSDDFFISDSIIARLFEEIIDKRQLNRIEDPEIRDISYWGFILRFLTADLINQVLQPILQFRKLSDEAINDILNKLTQYSWLAYSDEGKVWHNQNTRNSTLPLILKKEPEKVSRLRKAAIAYFLNKGGEADNAEAVYHELMDLKVPNDGIILSLNRIKSAYNYLNSNLDEFSPLAISLLRYAMGSYLFYTEVLLLPDEYFENTFNRTGKELIQTENYTGAFRLIMRAIQLNYYEYHVFDDEEYMSYNWEEETLFNLSEWILLLDIKIQRRQVTRTLGTLVSYLYPMTFILPELINGAILQDYLIEMLMRNSMFEKLDNLHLIETALNRLSTCLIILKYKRLIYNTSMRSIKKFIPNLKSLPHTPIINRSITILKMIALQPLDRDYLIGTELVKAEYVWMEFLLPENHFNQEYPDTLMNLFYNRTFEPRQFLTDLNRYVTYYGERSRIGIDLSENDQLLDFQLLRGPDRFYESACKFAIIEYLNVTNNVSRLIEVIRSYLPGNVFAPAKQDILRHMQDNSSTLLDPYIEIISRGWNMLPFLKTLNDHNKNLQKINNIIISIELWDKSIEELISDYRKHLDI